MEEPTKWRLAIASAALAGAAVGAVALGPSLASAQDGDSTTTTTVEPDTTGTTDSTGTTDGTETAPEGCEPGEGGPGRGFGRGPGLDAAAEVIGIEASALRDALVSGQTIAEVAEANGVAVADVVAAMVADAQEHLAEAVADGRLTQEEADERAADIEERITALVNGELELRGPGGPGHHGGPWGDRPDADPDTDTGS